MNKLISLNQTARGMCLIRVVVANEVVDEALRSKNSCFIFKVNFEKVMIWSVGIFLFYMIEENKI